MKETRKKPSSELIEFINDIESLHEIGGVSESEIKKAERALKLSFADDYREYLLNFGCISFTGTEMTGLCKSEYKNVVNATKETWEQEEQVPHNMYLIENTAMDGILLWQDSSGSVYVTKPYQRPKRYASSLLEYIKKSVEGIKRKN